MTPEPELERLIQDVRTVTNKQVEIFDRLRHVEERLDVLVERLRKCEDRARALESVLAQTFPAVTPNGCHAGRRSISNADQFDEEISDPLP